MALFGVLGGDQLPPDSFGDGGLVRMAANARRLRAGGHRVFNLWMDDVLERPSTTLSHSLASSRRPAADSHMGLNASDLGASLTDGHARLFAARKGDARARERTTSRRPIRLRPADRAKGSPRGPFDGRPRRRRRLESRRSVCVRARHVEASWCTPPRNHSALNQWCDRCRCAAPPVALCWRRGGGRAATHRRLCAQLVPLARVPAPMRPRAPPRAPCSRRGAAASTPVGARCVAPPSARLLPRRCRGLGPPSVGGERGGARPAGGARLRSRRRRVAAAAARARAPGGGGGRPSSRRVREHLRGGGAGGNRLRRVRARAGPRRLHAELRRPRRRRAGVPRLGGRRRRRQRIPPLLLRAGSVHGGLLRRREPWRRLLPPRRRAGSVLRVLVAECARAQRAPAARDGKLKALDYCAGGATADGGGAAFSDATAPPPRRRTASRRARPRATRRRSCARSATGLTPPRPRRRARRRVGKSAAAERLESVVVDGFVRRGGKYFPGCQREMCASLPRAPRRFAARW